MGDRPSEWPFMLPWVQRSIGVPLVQMDTANPGAIALHSAIEICGTPIVKYPVLILTAEYCGGATLISAQQIPPTLRLSCLWG